ncbi:hypothetical protein ES705_29134 [subsurface metagenome]
MQTPGLDGLAERGARFETFYSGCAVCSPSRATLLTGRHHIRTGIYNWISDSTQCSHLLEREVTIAELLMASGYGTAHFGKWHLGLSHGGYSKPTPSDHGFDYWFATANNANPSHRNPVNYFRNGKPVGEIKGYSCQIVADEAISWLENQRDKSRPFFLNVWFHEPHRRVAAPDSLVTIYQDEEQWNGLDPVQAKMAPIYSGSIHNSDLAISRLLEYVWQISPPENTLIIYTSDNGSYMLNRNGTLRGHKGLNWEGGLRVPGIYSWPGMIPEGVILDTPSGIVDMLPTLCGLLDLDPPEEVYLDGSDISPLLLGHPKDFIRHQPFFWHLQRSKPIVAMRDGPYVLVAYRDNQELPMNNRLEEEWIPMIKKGGYVDFQLFNLEKDPGQTTDISGQVPGLFNEMKSKLLSINESVLSEGTDWHLIIEKGNE